MKIAPVLFQQNKFSFEQTKKTNIIDNKTQAFASNLKLAKTYPNSYYFLNFNARVEKDLDSFVNRNKNTLPYSVKAYISNLTPEQKIQKTPLQVQKEAFQYLEICQSVDDVRDIYPNELLFQDLIEASENKSNRGFLYDVRLIQDDLLQDNQTLFQNGENNLTLYLLKKIFLEGKTIEEINSDLNEELNDIFQGENKKFIQSSTLKALGIKLPDVTYLNSLRYTREGYSDEIGKKISQRWNELSDEQKQAIRKNLKLNSTYRTWSEERKSAHSELMKKYWLQMTPEQKAEQIEKMHSGDEKQRIIMIAAWTKLFNIRVSLSEYLTQNNCHNFDDVLEGKVSINQAMSNIMKQYWLNNSQYCEEISNAIEEASKEYENAFENERLDEYLKEVHDKNIQIKTLVKEVISAKQKTKIDTLVEDFKNSFSFLPDDLMKVYSKKLSKLDENSAELFIKYCKGEKLQDSEMKYVEELSKTELSMEGSIPPQAYLVAFTHEVEKCITPIVDLKKGNKVKPCFPLFVDIRLCNVLKLQYRILNGGYDTLNLLDYLTKIKNERIDEIQSVLDDGPMLLVSRNVDMDDVKSRFQHYKYPLGKKPDIDAIKNNYNVIMKTKPDFYSASKLFREKAPLLNPQIRNKIARSLSERPDFYWELMSEDKTLGAKYKVLSCIRTYIMNYYKNLNLDFNWALDEHVAELTNFVRELVE